MQLNVIRKEKYYGDASGDRLVKSLWERRAEDLKGGWGMVQKRRGQGLGEPPGRGN